jgi:hypothetical protein
MERGRKEGANDAVACERWDIINSSDSLSLSPTSAIGTARNSLSHTHTPCYSLLLRSAKAAPLLACCNANTVISTVSLSVPFLDCAVVAFFTLPLWLCAPLFLQQRFVAPIKQICAGVLTPRLAGLIAFQGASGYSLLISYWYIIGHHFGCGPERGRGVVIRDSSVCEPVLRECCACSVTESSEGHFPCALVSSLFFPEQKNITTAHIMRQ